MRIEPRASDHGERRRLSRYFRPAAKKHAAAITPKMIGAKRGNAAIGKIAGNVRRGLEVIVAGEDARP